MALSFCSNWAAAPDYLNPPDTAPFHDDQQAYPLLGFHDPFDPSHFLIDSLFDPLNDDPFYAEPNSSLSDPSLLSVPPDKLDLYPCPKRPKSCGDLCHPPDAVVGPRESDSRVLPPLGVGIFLGCGGGNKARSGCPSAQSVAARERRKRISEKTQELGRLIPGGSKMNTAEMFQAAFKYVKFLQAQVGVLGLLGSTQGCRASPEVEEHIQSLLASPTVQEKLYGDGRCIVPKGVVEALAEDQEIKSNRLICRDLDRFVKSMG